MYVCVCVKLMQDPAIQTVMNKMGICYSEEYELSIFWDCRISLKDEYCNICLFFAKLMLDGGQTNTSDWSPTFLMGVLSALAAAEG